MRKIQPVEMGCEDLFFACPEVFPESWMTRKSFSLYWDQPRPVCALFFVKSDLRVCFFSLEGDTITARRGDVVFIPEGSRYRVRIEGEGSHGIDSYTVNFRLFDAQGETVTLSDKITFLASSVDGLFDLHFQKVSEAAHRAKDKSASLGNRLTVRAALYSLLDAVASATPETHHAYYAIREGADLLQQEWNQNHKIERYAALCGVSATYFYRCFREWTGKSPVEYRNALRLSHAESMLRHTDMQVSEIAEVIGFEDPFYFCRLFVRRFGASPQKYRSSLRKKA